MRLAAISVFFATFAATAWVLTPPPTSDSTVEPVRPLPPTPFPPDLPPEPLDPEDLAILNDCANDPDCPRECRVEAIRRLFTHYLKPPSDAVRVSKVLQDPRWLSDVKIERTSAWFGHRVGSLGDARYPVFCVELFPAHDEPLVMLAVRVSGLDDPGPDDFRSFLRAEVTSAARLQIEEFAWQDRCIGWSVAHYERHRVPASDR
ncbi:MAG: hypothetical protein J2P46_07810 [Zavarzinella sp.]|nr:hypothetical protein [Zavarzinella sp.]